MKKTFLLLTSLLALQTVYAQAGDFDCKKKCTKLTCSRGKVFDECSEKCDPLPKSCADTGKKAEAQRESREDEREKIKGEEAAAE